MQTAMIRQSNGRTMGSAAKERMTKFAAFKLKDPHL